MLDILSNALGSINPFKDNIIYEFESVRVQQQELISEGGYGYVYKCIDLDHPEKKTYALKKINCQGPDVEDEMREIIHWKAMGDHPNIVKYIDYKIVQTDNRQK